MPDKYGNHPCKYIFAGNCVRQIRHFIYNAPPEIELKNFLYKKQNEIPPIKVYDPKYLSKDDAFKLIQRIKLVDLQNNNVLVSQLIIPASTVIKVDMSFSMFSPNFDSWLFVIDLMPDAKWDHPCKYIFVDIVSKKTKIFDMNCPPLIPLEYLKSASNN